MQGQRLTSVLGLSLIGCLLGSLSAQAAPAPVVGKVDFEKHVMGVLSRMGCNAGACHGSFQGKGGFYLSLFGYSPEKDHASLTRDALGRRINRADPERSLIILKATGQVVHGGGQRFGTGSEAYRTLLEWVRQGAAWEKGSGDIKRVRVSPEEHTFARPGEGVQLKVIAEYTDGTEADVTALSTFRIQDDYVAEVTPEGAVNSLRPGDTGIIVSYRSNVVASRVLIPSPVGKAFTYPKVPETGYIDREVFAKLRKLNIVPSDLSSDGEFLRRLYIDTIGTLPPPDEVRAFLKDRDPNKRTKKIDELLRHPMHAALWATKFSDITGNNVDEMQAPNNLRNKYSKMWHDWFRQRIEQNMPYDRIVEGVVTATSRGDQDLKEWAEEAVNLMLQANEGFDTDYPKREHLDLFWARRNFGVEQMAERTATAFLGVRIECAQCHKHPFDRWSVEDYRAFANLFAQVTYGSPNEARKVVDDAAKKLNGKIRGRVQISQVYVNYSRPRDLRHPDTNASLNPRPLGGEQVDLRQLGKDEKDARELLFKWMVRPDNPYFARSFVNRVWAHYLGVGIVDPVDDFAVANPPSNPRLLDALAEDFIKSGYDIRKLERTILLSRTYQLSATPNESNKFDRQNFSRGYARRMMAEVMVDVLNEALASTENYGRDVPEGIRAIEIAPNRIQSPTLTYVFSIFGRPPRGTTCDCERPSEPALPQTLYMMTDTNLLNKITGGRLRKLIAAKKSDEEIVEEFFLATLARVPNDGEKQAALETIKANANRQNGLADVVWALINTREFILNH
jgi:hypothetical protein